MPGQKMNMLGDGGPSRTPLDELQPPPPARRPENPMGSGALPPLQANPLPLPGYPRNYSPRVASSSQPAASKYATLDELYARNAEELNGDFQLRVTRLSPSTYMDEDGVSCSVRGFLGYESRPISLEEFSRKYGGRRYSVALLKPHPEKVLPNGNPIMITLGTVEFDVPGEPNLQVLPSAPGADPNTGEIMSPYGRRMYGGGPVQPQPQGVGAGEVVTAALNFATSRGGNQQSDPSVVHAITNSSAAAMQATQQMAQQQIELLNQQLEAAHRQIRESAKQPTDMVQMVQAVAMLNDASRTKVSSQEIDALERRFAMERESLEKLHRDALDRLRVQHSEEKESIRRQSEDAVRRAEERVKDLMSSHLAEKELLKAEGDRRERTARNEVEARLNMMKDQLDNRIREAEKAHDNRVRELERAHERDMTSQQQNFERELKSAERMYKMTSETGSQSTAMQMAILTQQLTQKEQELLAVRTEISQLRERYVNKSPMEAIQEATSVVQTLQNHFGGGGEKEEKKSLGERAVDGLMQNAPAMLGLLGSFIKPPAAAPQAAPQAPPAAVQPRQLPPPQSTEQKPRRRQPPKMVWQEDDGPPIHVGPPPPPPPSERPDYQVPSSVGSYSPDDRPVAAAVPEPPPPPPPPPSPQQGEQPQSQMPVVGQWSGLEWTGLPENNLVELFSLLEQNCSSNISPGQTADGLIQKYSPEIMRIAVSQIDVDRLCLGISQAPATAETVLATKKGKKWVKALWSSLNQKLAEAT